MTPGDASALTDYVTAHAPGYGLDPRAVLAVADQEGISGKIGDHGTSFGPWQLHQGGAYPASAPQAPQLANAWAWSPAGINYALAQMSKVAGNQKGATAVHSIVYEFERPSNPAAEFAAAMKAYSSSSSSLPPPGNQVTGSSAPPGSGVVSAVGGVAGGIDSAFSGVTSVLSFIGSIRFLEVVGGGILLLLGVYLLARRVGLAPQARTIAAATPAGRAAAAAGALR